MPHPADDYLFFWKPEQPYGWASQWYTSPFTAHLTLPGDSERAVTFATAEHWMMAQKALLFGDVGVFGRIGKAQDPKTVKALGREVSGFDDTVWKRERERIVLEGSLLKFRQDEALKRELLATGEKVLVEASPRDRIWGIGFGATNAVNNKERWGLNLLGKALMEARRILAAETQAGATKDDSPTGDQAQEI